MSGRVSTQEKMRWGRTKKTNTCGKQLEAAHDDAEVRERLLADRLDGHREAHQDAGRLGDPRRVLLVVVILFLLILLFLVIVVILFIILVTVTVALFTAVAGSEGRETRPVAVDLGLAHLLLAAEHDDGVRAGLPDHAPEVVDRVPHRALRRDERVRVERAARVEAAHPVRVDKVAPAPVRERQHNARVVKRQDVRVAALALVLGQRARAHRLGPCVRRLLVSQSLSRAKKEKQCERTPRRKREKGVRDKQKTQCEGQQRRRAQQARGGAPRWGGRLRCWAAGRHPRRSRQRQTRGGPAPWVLGDAWTDCTAGPRRGAGGACVSGGR